MTISPGATGARVRVHVAGTVQGVGFRPHVHRLATELRLAGFVLNDERGVALEVEGAPGRVEEFLRRLRAESPPLAVVETVESEDMTPRGESGFRILASSAGGQADALVSPDVATCAECLAELFDPADRRHRYPFINCTNCGPRFTIVAGVPYDRPLTTMASFAMCDACRAEYDDPLDRRFHAQPNACPECGPQVRLADGQGRPLSGAPGGEAIAAAAALLDSGRIVAVKGIGGFHLACRADDARAVATLRARKHREEKPFALMAANVDAARELVALSEREAALLQGRERPIVIARRRRGAAVSASVAPRSHDLGVMLPYSPLHHLLLADCAATLVMTSGNVSDEPIAYDDADALRRLGAIADAFLLHDRPIHTRTDDSVVRAVDPALRSAPVLLRRSRGYAPRSIELPLDAPRPVLACGAELKSAVCVARGRRAWVSQHLGDLANWEVLSSFREAIRHFERLFAVQPEVVAHDLHPDYLSTAHARELEGIEPLAVQHHHAHLAACLAEHGESAPAVGAIFDGTGWGTDATIWGGEVLLGDLAGFERVGMVHPVRLPGGDAAVREPWRMACAWLAAASGEPEPSIPPALRDRVDEREWRAVCELVRTGVGSPVTTSAGRLFDAVAALAGVRSRVSYEGQAAAELEGIADRREQSAYAMPLRDGEGSIVLDARETVLALAADLSRGASPAAVAARFHGALAGATAQACARVAEERRIGLVVLSGGVFQNRLLLERTAQRLRADALRVLIPERLPPNDGGIAYGQAAVAAARDATVAEVLSA